MNGLGHLNRTAAALDTLTLKNFQEGGTTRCNRAAKSGVLKWLINRRRWLIGTVDATPVDAMLDDRGPYAVALRIPRGTGESCSVFGYNRSDYKTDYYGPI